MHMHMLLQRLLQRLAAWRNKPAVLYPLRFQGHDCKVPPLQVVIGREDGQTYYSSEPLQSSPFAVWMLHASDNKQKAYSRLPLLLTPSTSLQFPTGFFKATLTEDIAEKQTWVVQGMEVKVEVVKTKRQSISPPLAKDSGIFPRNAEPTWQFLYAAGQWRSFCPQDPFLEQAFRLRRSCVKPETAGKQGCTSSYEY